MGGDCSDASLHLCREGGVTTMYVAAYRTSQCFGGPEEGGWYYEHGEPVAAVPITVTYRWIDRGERRLYPEVSIDEYERVRKLLEETLGYVDLRVCLENMWPTEYPRFRPHYE
jgi:hypothetical protein